MNSEQLKKRAGILAPERRAHTERVVGECRELAKKFALSGADTERLINAAYLHDITKRLTPAEHIALASAFGLKLDRSSPETMHQITGAELARREFPEIVDDEVYAAIANHTTGEAAMSQIEKLLFLADCIEPGRTHEVCRQIRSQFYRMLKYTRPEDALDRAVADSLSFTIDYLEKNGLPIDKKTVGAQKYYSMTDGTDNIVDESDFADVIQPRTRNSNYANLPTQKTTAAVHPDRKIAYENSQGQNTDKGNVKKMKKQSANDIVPEVSNTEQKKKKKFRVLRVILVILAVLLLLAGGVVGYLHYNKYMYTPDSNTAAPRDDINQKETGASGEGNYNFLIAAKDAASSSTDVIMVVNFNYGLNNGGAKTATIMQIPRDTYVKIDGYGRKINSIYSHYYDGNTEKEKIENGMAGLADVISKNMNISFDATIMLDLKGFVKIVDEIGGVPMYVPWDMKYEDPDQDLYIDLKKGDQVLDGEHAEQFVRFRKGFALADLARGDAQKMFMTAFIKQVKNTFSISTIDSLVKFVRDYTTMTFKAGFSFEDLLNYGQNALEVNMEDIIMFTAPGTASTFNGGSYYVLHRNDMITLLGTYFEKNYTIDDNSFDHDKVFYAAGSDKYYYADPSDIEKLIHPADDIEENGIEITLTK